MGLGGPLEYEGGSSNGEQEEIIIGGSGSSSGEEGTNPVLDPGGDAVSQGIAPTSYDYQIVGQNAAVGGSYVALQNSNLTANGSVAVLSRLCSYLVANTSSAKLNACAAYVGNFGYAASKTSSIDVVSSVSSIHKFNYYAGSGSSISTKYSQSIFPMDFSQYAAFNGSITNIEFETATRWWDDDAGANATHFGSVASSYIQNSSTQLSTLTLSAGFSGSGIVGTQPLRFIWSEYFTPVSQIGNVSTSLGAGGYASYNYVPFAHSADFSNIVGTSTPFATVSVVNLLPPLFGIITYRNNYQSVKPPAYMKQPEDGSGATGAGNLYYTSSYSLATLVSNGFSI
jgi:hypothetical protein